jgi:uncharacterized protein
VSEKPNESVAAWAARSHEPEAALLRRKRLALEELREADAARSGRGPDRWTVFSAPWLLEKALWLTRAREQGELNANAPVLGHVTVSHPHLPPALEGFRLLQISDPHFDNRPGFTEAASRIVRGIDCDLCVVTGDFRFYNTGPPVNVFEGMRAILAGVRARLGCYGVLGNHDSLHFVPQLEEAGVRMLVNQGIPIAVGDAAIWLAGTDDPHYYRCDSLKLAMKGAPDHAFVVGLIHSPEVIKEAARRGVHLYLCGHTHGGQVCLPGGLPVYVNARCRYRYARGPWQYRRMLGYTTTGLGTTDIPVRFYCPPEVLLFTLRRGELRVIKAATS